MELKFEGYGVACFEQGDSMLIPGGLRQNELCASDDFKLIEASISAAMDTVACEGPEPTRS